MALKAILFDLDGTLVDTDPIHRAVFAEILAPLGYKVDEEFFRTHISGSRNEEIFGKYFPRLSEREIIRKAEEKERLFREQARNIKPMSGLDRILQWAEENDLHTALVTNAPRGNVDFILPILGLEKAFDLWVLADELEKGKPDPEPYLSALSRLKISADEAVVFEDSGNGIRSASGAGIFTYGMTSTHPASELLAVGADMAISDFSDPALWDDLAARLYAS